jgi:hypothetical protein
MTPAKRKRGRPRTVGTGLSKAPTDRKHRLTPRIKQAIEAMIADGLSVKEAAEVAGLTREALYKAMRDNPVARSFYASELRAFLHCTKHLAAHTLIKEMKGDNAAARVAAARTLLADDARPAPPAGQAQTPGFVFMMVDARGGDAMPINGHAAAPLQIEAKAIDDGESEQDA